MKLSLPIAATLVAAVTTLSGAGITKATAAECTGQFRQCAFAVNAVCSTDPGGRQRMTYWDSPGRTISFEQCVGRIFEAAGHPNPYKTGITTSGNMTVPYTELQYPLIDP
jgi:hypothetical protein